MASQGTVSPRPGPVTVSVGGVAIGTSQRALDLREGSYPPAIQAPRRDIGMARLTPTDRSTTCPHKGAASIIRS